MGQRAIVTPAGSRGFSLTELMMVVAFATTLMAMSVPIVSDIAQSTKLNEAARLVERELQNARLRAVNVNRPLRVRINCPSIGYIRTVEYIGTTADTSTNRCLASAYPFPAGDMDVMTKPNYDGPLRAIPPGATVATGTIEFEPNGTAMLVVSNTPQTITTSVSITVTRAGKSKTVTVNGAGKIQLQ